MRLLQFLCIPFLFVIAGCSGCEDDPLSFSKTEYIGNQLRIDGYYYHDYATDPKTNEHYVEVYFFYKNGVLLTTGGGVLSRIEEEEKKWLTSEWQNSSKDTKFRWGVFKIDGDNIQFDRWYPSEKPYSVYTRGGVILNDTTFEINESYKMVDGTKTEIQKVNEVYHFKKFSPKPDSINPYVVRF